MTVIEDKEQLGICKTCRHKTDCIFIKDSTHLVLHCEEFEVYKFHRVQNNELPDEIQLVQDEAGKYTGLCINCDNRSYCINAEAEHIVWQCQQYV